MRAPTIPMLSATSKTENVSSEQDTRGTRGKISNEESQVQ